jgi:predicted RNA binding protein YcfA (HicA-like mRNA interferase family)
MRYSELRRKLRRLGCEPLRQAGGSHEIWWRPETELRAVVPNYAAREIPTGTLRAILRDLGLTLADLNQA